MNTNKCYKLLVEKYTDCEGRHWDSKEIGYFHTEENARKYANTFEEEIKNSGDLWIDYLRDRNGHFIFTIESIEFLD